MSNDKTDKPNATTSNLRTIPWQRVHLYEKREVDGRMEFRAVFDNNTKARVLAAFRETRKLKPGYSFFPLDIIFTTEGYDRDASVIHALSLIWYQWNDRTMSFDRMLDPITILKLSTALHAGDRIPDGFSTLNYVVEYNGIEEKAKPFNAPRVKL